ncbi:DUF3822 family protein [Sphingobacterium sp. MYb382]|uniref:DUF3822 family protein n=1 Tax=Sphingobacterium sp. MYb382 TaxID=2745278 RepID=UPI00309D6EFF
MNYTSKNFQLHYLSSYKLLVKTDFQQDTLLVLNADNEVEILYTYAADAPDSEAMKLLSLPFQQVFINIPLQSLILVPSEVYDDQDVTLYQGFQQDERLDRTNSLSLEEWGLTASYQYDLLLHNRWRKIFPEAKFVADFQMLMHQLKANLPAEGLVLGAQFRDQQVDMYCFNDGDLQFYSTFDILTAEDLKYFVWNTLQTLGVKQRASQFVISGVASNHAYVTALRPFADKVIPLQGGIAIHYPDVLAADRMEALNLLTTAPLCV